MSRINFFKKHIIEGRILDVGNLGPDGEMHRAICSEFPKISIIGIDNNKEKAERFNFPNQVVGDITHPLPFDNNYFDAVYLGEVLEHVWDPKKLLEEVYRILKKDGVIIIDTPNPYAILKIIRFIIKGKDFLGDPTHKIFFSPIILKNLLEKTGFIVKEITTDRKFSFKKIKFIFPNMPPFRWLGSHLCAAAFKK